MRTTQRAPRFLPPPRADRPAEGDPAGPERELAEPRACYVCKQAFRRVHVFYDALCPPCAALNYEMRFPKGDLAGASRWSPARGSRSASRPRSCCCAQGARVIVTTRFPRDAAQRFARVADFAEWADRLARLRARSAAHAPASSCSRATCGARHPHLDILINNAAQTVRRPAAFYAHLLAAEAPRHDGAARGRRAAAARTTRAARPSRRGTPRRSAGSSGGARGLVGFRGRRAGLGLTDSARSRSCRAATTSRRGAVGTRAEARPVPGAGTLDGDLPAGRSAPHNSWRHALAEVPTGRAARGPPRERGRALRAVRAPAAADAALAARRRAAS